MIKKCVIIEGFPAKPFSISWEQLRALQDAELIVNQDVSACLKTYSKCSHYLDLNSIESSTVSSRLKTLWGKANSIAIVKNPQSPIHVSLANLIAERSGDKRFEVVELLLSEAELALCQLMRQAAVSSKLRVMVNGQRLRDSNCSIEPVNSNVSVVVYNPICGLKTLETTLVHLCVDNPGTALVYSRDSISSTECSVALQTFKMQKKPLTAREMIVVGDAVNPRELEEWWAQFPLLGKTILITRAVGQTEALSKPLRKLGAHTPILPLTRFAPIEDAMQSSMFESLCAYRWILFTSVNAVRFFFAGLARQGISSNQPKDLRVACIGPSTKKAIESAGWSISKVAVPHTSEGLFDVLSQEPLRNIRVLIPCAKKTRGVLLPWLKDLGALVSVIPIYEQELTEPDENVSAQLNTMTIDAVAFCAPSAVIAFENWLQTPQRDTFKRSVFAFCIGPSTATTAQETEYSRVKMAGEHTIDGLIQSIVAYFGQHES